MKSLLEFIHNSITTENQESALFALEELSQIKESDDIFYNCELIRANMSYFQKYNEAI